MALVDELSVLHGVVEPGARSVPLLLVRRDEEEELGRGAEQEAMTAEEEVLKYETHENGRIVVMTLNRPDQRNALSTELRQALNEGWQRFAQDDEAWVAIITGAGPAFCAGNDLRERRQVADGERPDPRREMQRQSPVKFPINESLNL